jgi:hypothetical protein
LNVKEALSEIAEEKKKLVNKLTVRLMQSQNCHKTIVKMIFLAENDERV